MSSVVMPTVSALTAGVLLILQTFLMLVAANNRRRARQALGDDGADPAFTRAHRRHGNLAENAAIFLIGVALYEMLGGPAPWVEGLCAAFVLARLSHALGLSMKNTVNFFRVGGVTLTVAVNVMLGLRLVALAVHLLPASDLGVAHI